MQLEKVTPKAKALAQVARAINNRMRQRMIAYLLANPGTMVTDLYYNLRLVQSVCSSHLAILRNAGLVTAKREGKNIYYSVNERMFRQVEAAANLLKQPA